MYGFLYELSPKDEKSLDQCELIYEKRIIPIQLITSSGNGKTAAKKTVDALVYIDFVNTSRDVPQTEYIHRMNMGLKDALQMGISQSYIDEYIRPSILPE